MRQPGSMPFFLIITAAVGEVRKFASAFATFGFVVPVWMPLDPSAIILSGHLAEAVGGAGDEEACHRYRLNARHSIGSNGSGMSVRFSPLTVIFSGPSA